MSKYPCNQPRDFADPAFIIGRFLNAHTVRSLATAPSPFSVPVGKLYAHYVQWAKAEGIVAITQRQFAYDIMNLGFRRQKTANEHTFVGIRLSDGPGRCGRDAKLFEPHAPQTVAPVVAKGHKASDWNAQ